MELNFSPVFESMPLLVQGAKLTAYITFVGLVGGIILGMLLGMIRSTFPVHFSKEKIRHSPLGGVVMPIVSLIAQGYILLIRGTPIMVQVMFIYYALPLLFGGWRIENYNAAIIAIVINSGAYIAETVRGSFQSVSKGLFEAGMVMGLPTWKIVTKIIGPVAFRRMIPSLGNQCIISLKDTSIFIVIGVAELTRRGQDIVAETYRAVEVWAIVALIYLIMTSIMAIVLKVLERRMRIL